MSRDRIRTLQNATLLANVQDVELAEIAKLVKVVDVKEGETLAVRGQASPGMVLVESGALEAILESVPICTLSPGSLFDEEALVAVDAPAPATLRAAEPSKIGLLDRKSVVRELARLPGTKMALDAAWKRHVLAARLHTIDLFAGLEPAVLRKICDQFDLIEIAGGTTLAREGEPGNCLYVVREGELLLKLPPGGPDDPTSVPLGVLEYLGDLSLIEDKPHGATVEAPYDVQVAKLDRRSFGKAIAGTKALELIKAAIKRRDESIL